MEYWALFTLRTLEFQIALVQVTIAAMATQDFPHHPYAVVRFIRANQVEAVPSCWVKNRTTCLWPSGFSASRLKKAIHQCESPDSSFAKFKIVLIGTASTYKRAREKSILAEDTDNIPTTDGERGRSKRRHTSREAPSRRESSPSCDSDEDSTPPQTPPSFETIGDEGNNSADCNSPPQANVTQCNIQQDEVSHGAQLQLEHNTSGSTSSEFGYNVTLPVQIPASQVSSRPPRYEMPSGYNDHLYMQIPASQEPRNNRDAYTLPVGNPQQQQDYYVSSGERFCEVGSYDAPHVIDQPLMLTGSHQPSAQQRTSQYHQDYQASPRVLYRAAPECVPERWTQGQRNDSSFQNNSCQCPSSRRILMDLAFLKNQNQHIMSVLDKLAFTHHESAWEGLDFPLKTQEQLERLEEKLENGDSRGALVKRLACLGGANVGQAVRAYLRYLLSDDLAADFSLYGKKAKRCLASLRLWHVIRDAVNTNTRTRGAPLDEIKAVTMVWLKNAKARRERN